MPKPKFDLSGLGSSTDFGIRLMTSKQYQRIQAECCSINHVLQDGEPCPHDGCINHVTHGCPVCFRKKCKGQYTPPHLFTIADGYTKSSKDDSRQWPVVRFKA